MTALICSLLLSLERLLTPRTGVLLGSWLSSRDGWRLEKLLPFPAALAKGLNTRLQIFPEPSRIELFPVPFRQVLPHLVRGEYVQQPTGPTCVSNQPERQNQDFPTHISVRARET